MTTEKITGLYRHYNMQGDLLYVGISLNAVNRSYGHSRAAPWWDEITNITVERFPSRGAAEAAERAAIQNEKPRYNKIRARASQADVEVYMSKSKKPQVAMKWVSDLALADYFSVSRCTIWRWVKIGKLPPPMKLGENTTRWDFDKAVDAVMSTARPFRGEEAA